MTHALPRSQVGPPLDLPHSPFPVPPGGVPSPWEIGLGTIPLLGLGELRFPGRMSGLGLGGFTSFLMCFSFKRTRFIV